MTLHLTLLLQKMSPKLLPRQELKLQHLKDHQLLQKAKRYLSRSLVPRISHPPLMKKTQIRPRRLLFQSQLSLLALLQALSLLKDQLVLSPLRKAAALLHLRAVTVQAVIVATRSSST